MKKKIYCGIMPKEKYIERTIKIAKGEYKPKKNEPKIWFESLKTAAQILNPENMYLLKVIDEKKPDSITALAEITGRAKSNLSRTLKTMESYGIIELERNNKKTKPIVKATDFNIDFGSGSFPSIFDQKNGVVRKNSYSPESLKKSD